MFTVIIIMFCGIALGYLFRRDSRLQQTGKAVTIAIVLLLFLMGVSVGANKAILDNLGTLGMQALLIAVAGTAGSVLAGWAVYRLFFKERGKP